MPYKPAPKSIENRSLLIGLQGLPDSGKTHFCLTGKEPIAILNLDRGLKGVVQKFADKEISVGYYPVPAVQNLKEVDDETKEQARVVWNDFFSDYRKFLDDKTQTIVIDGASRLWRLVRIGLIGKLIEAMPRQYSLANEIYAQLFTMAKDSNKDVIFTHRVSDEYQNNKPTGKVKLDGYKSTLYEVHVHFSCSFVPNRGFLFKYERCKMDINLLGEMLENPTVEDVRQQVFERFNQEVTK